MVPTATKASSGFHYAFLIVASGIVITCVPCALVLSCAGIFFTPVSEYFGVPRASFTMYFSILNLFQMITLPFAGKVMSRVDLRIVLSACVIVCGATYLAMSQFVQVWQFYIAGALLGVGIAPLIYMAVPTLINAWCVKKVGFFVGLCMAFTGIGGVIFNPVGTALINMGADGWRTAYFAFGLLMLVCTLPFTLFVVRTRPSDKGLEPYGAGDAGGEEKAFVPVVEGAPASLAMKTLAFVTVAAFCFFVTFNQHVYSFLPTYASSFANTVPQVAALSGLIASACMAGQAIGKVVLGAVNDRSAKAGLLLAVVCGVAGVACMWFLPQVSAVFLLGGFLFGFIYACITVQTPLLTREVFGSLDYANIYSRVSVFGTLAGVIAPTFLGWLVEMPHGFDMMFMLSLGSMAVALVLGLVSLSQGAWLKRERPLENGKPKSVSESRPE